MTHSIVTGLPKHPTLDEREALSSYLHLTSRLYPCGECAAEFQVLLQKYPPQVCNATAISYWCFTLLYRHLQDAPLHSGESVSSVMHGDN